MHIVHFLYSLFGSAFICLALVETSLAGCDEVHFTYPDYSIGGYGPPEVVDSFLSDRARNAAVAACRAAHAKADKLMKEVERLPSSYDRKGSDLKTLMDYKRSVEEGRPDAGRYEKFIEDDAVRRKNEGWILNSAPRTPDPGGIRLGVVPKGNAANLSDVRGRVLELRSPNY